MSFIKMREIKEIYFERRVIDIENPQKAIEFLDGFEGCFAIGWYENTILFDVFDSSKKEFFSEKLINLRIFNQTKEAFIFKNSSGFKLRLIEDSKDREYIEYFDAEQVLVGTNIEEKNDTIRIFEDRGFYFDMPKYMLKDALKLENKTHYIVLKTRNYINYLPNYQATIEDVRFVDIFVKQIGG